MKKLGFLIVLIVLAVFATSTTQAAVPGFLRPFLCPVLAAQTYQDSYNSCIGNTGPSPSEFEEGNCRDEADRDSSRALFGCMAFGYGMLQTAQNTPEPNFTPKDPLRETLMLTRTKMIFERHKLCS